MNYLTQQVIHQIPFLFSLQARKEVHLFDRLIEAGKRLICPARPRYGQSTPYAMANLAAWGEIVAVLVDQPGLAGCDVLGMSSGAPYSYAIGYKMPGKVRRRPSTPPK